VAAALARHGGRRSAAARELGLTRQGLAKAIKRLGLSATEVEGVA
jgi:transcriptional regulator with GAF, ATPase, and Fis domain